MYTFLFPIETVGVIAEGEIMEKQICSRLKHVVAGSDGLWNFCSEDEVVSNIHYSSDLAKTAVMSVLTSFGLGWLVIE